jgi:hypothetical protein
MQATMTDRIHALQAMSTSELRAEWQRIMNEPPRSNSRVWLWRRLSWAIQAREFGGLSARAQERLKELLPHAETWMPIGRKAFQDIGTPLPVPQARNARLPAIGTEIVRLYRGRNLVVRILEDGYEFEGRRYSSLTAIVKTVTGGSHQSGPRFFGLKGSEEAP